MEILYLVISFILFLSILYLIYLLLFLEVTTPTTPVISSPGGIPKPTPTPNKKTDPSKNEIVVPGEEILHNLKLNATNDNNSTALSYVEDYYRINNQYKQILIEKQNQETTSKYRSEEQYEPTSPNQMICKFANSGLPFVGFFAKFCTILPDSTKCHDYDNNFDGWCQKEYGNNQSFGVSRPSQLVSGQESKYNGGCPGGLVGIGGQGRAQCAFGYAGNKKLPLNSTQCYLTTADFDNACREQAGNKNDYAKGVMSDYIFGVKNYLEDGNYGCWKGQRRAECGLNYAGGKALKPNSTQCKLDTTDWDGQCRWSGGNKVGYTGDEPSQETWGQKSLYTGSSAGCIGGQNRAECGKGYSAGQKLKDNSTKCYLWTEDFNQICKTDYGKDWILDTRSSPDPKDKSAGYGKYAGGCITGQGRGVCVKKSTLPKDAELPGAKCGLWTSLSSGDCNNDFGPEFLGFGSKKADCADGQGRVICKQIGNLPKKTVLWGIKCGLWDSVQDSWCKNDFGNDWMYIGQQGQNFSSFKPPANNNDVVDDCPGGYGRAQCAKPDIQWTKCSGDYWKMPAQPICEANFGKNSLYISDPDQDCGAGKPKSSGLWYQAKYKCATW